MDKKRIAVVFSIVFTNMIGAGAIVPILPLYAVKLLGASDFQASLVIALFYVAQFTAAPWVGRLSDHVGRRPVLIISQIGTVLSYIFLILAPAIGAVLDGWGLDLGMRSGLLIVFLARALDGATGGNITVAQAYVSDISPPTKRAQALGIVGGAMATGFLFGPAFGGLLAGLSLTAPFWGAVFITGVTLALTIFILDESLTTERKSHLASRKAASLPISHFLHNPTIVIILVIVFMVNLSFAALQGNLALYVDRVLFIDTPAQEVARNAGLMVTLLGMMVGVGQLFFLRPLVSRFGEQSLITGGHILYLFSLVSVSLIASPSPVEVMLLFVPLALGSAVSYPSLQALMTRFGNPHNNGRLLGLMQAATSLGFSIGPALGGFVFETIAPNAIFLLGSVILFVVVALSIALGRRHIPNSQVLPDQQPAPPAADPAD